jgi:thymidylate synthase (FAD)
MPEVKMIAWTHVNWNMINGHNGWTTDAKQGIEALVEFAGRLCYQSWHKPNELTATIAGYLRNIRKQKHFSVFEHGSATFLFEGVSRSFTHELIRHRHFSYSELSQRFVDVEDASIVTPPALKDDAEGRYMLTDVRDMVRQVYSGLVEHLKDRGFERKPAREAARAVMPNMTETKIVVTGNMRAWRHFINVRGSEHADAEIRTVAVEVSRQLLNLCPNLFEDVEFYSVKDQQCVRLGFADAS